MKKERKNKMEVKRRTLESPKMATKTEGEKKIKKDDMIIKGHIKVAKGLRQAKTTRDDQSPKISASSSSSSSPAYMMTKIKMGNYKNSIQRSENKTKKMENNHLKNKMVMNPKQSTEEITDIDKMMKNKKVWDCESTLYDSFELNSFNRQLDSAISSSARSMSMPHLSHTPPPSSETTTWSSTKKQQPPNKISRSLRKLMKSMFGPKQSNATLKAGHDRGVDMDKYYVVFDKTGSLTTIPESGESTTEMVGSEINSLVRKTTSERFPRSRLIGVSCY